MILARLDSFFGINRSRSDLTGSDRRSKGHRIYPAVVMAHTSVSPLHADGIRPHRTAWTARGRRRDFSSLLAFFFGVEWPLSGQPGPANRSVQSPRGSHHRAASPAGYLTAPGRSPLPRSNPSIPREEKSSHPPPKNPKTLGFGSPPRSRWRTPASSST